MNPENERREDELFQALFASLREDVAPSDPQLREKLHNQSAEVFAAESSQESKTPKTPKASKPTSRRNRMFIMTIRGLAATATVIAISLGLFTVFTPGDPSPAFADVLDNVSSARSLHLEVKWTDAEGKAWVQPGRMRVDLPDGTYRVVRGDREWHVDEKANRAASRSVAYFGKDDKIDPLRLLRVPAADADGLAEAMKNATIERTQRNGEEVDLYMASVPREKAGHATRIECIVDARTQAVRSLRSFAVRGERITPIAEVNILSIDKAIDEELFVLGDTLTEDGRIGKVTDLQGIVSVKPVMHRRFTPVTGPILIKPGDWLRTDVRGANAVAVRLVKETDITLGPGTLIELPTPQRIKLASGEVKIVATKKRPIELIGPDGKKTSVTGTMHYRVDRQTNQLVKVAKPPVWLGYFEGTTTQDSIGSLVAKVDGRNVPLTVGYHKVTVDVRDQIARTVIEESFVNRTRSRLEGVFYFPLPQDASISGFGMWIGNELVEADVVEKQRAREIYETILRENRDPGLLEWTGGNLFKARVFPIEGLSEKRIKITYTQVLPLKNGRYRYSYALQSEMLKLHPLRELAIDVKLSSAMPLGDVTCPTHLARIDKTAHTAHVEFTAQEYTPDRDFEVVVGPEKGDGTHLCEAPSGPFRQMSPVPFFEPEPVVVIPHRRGEDGYFMMLVTPPSPEGRWQRETLPDGEPLELLILADTSGSMDVEARKNQSELIASLLGSLTETDRVNLATCDVECDWIFEKPQPVTEKTIATIHERLDHRVSLGWTDLDAAFQSAATRCDSNTQLIYIGDGVVNTTDADPVAFASRLKRMFAKKGSGLFFRNGPKGASQKRVPTPFSAPSLHAISVGSSFDSIVMNTIASLGGGSARQVSGEQTPQKVAAELLAELTRPSIRDLAVSFDGLRTARVYPERLPNLATGKQQILIGRYLPEGADQHGRVTVTGMLGDEPVKFSTKVSLVDAEHGNSFIPRLWARMHLDTLLGQGSSSSIKDEIIGLSEEYHIITPYTSLLVLESDADRERFKVKRRFQMRDGQRFFADGRDRADFELMQKQMRLAGNWRLGLRRQVLRSLIGLGRDASVFQQAIRYDVVSPVFLTRSRVFQQASGYDINGMIPSSGSGTVTIGGVRRGSGLYGSYAPGKSHDWGDGDEVRFKQLNNRFAGHEIDYFSDKGHESRSFAFDPSASEEKCEDELDDWQRGESLSRDFFLREPPPARPSQPVVAKRLIGDRTDKHRSRWRLGESVQTGGFAHHALASQFGKWNLDIRARNNPPMYDTTWLTGLFLALGGPSRPPQPPEVRWPMDARRLAESLLRTESLAAVTGGLQIERTVEQFDPRWDTLSHRDVSRVLVSPDAWLARSGGGASQTLVNWCDKSERGVFSVDLELGRVRKATPADQEQPPLSLSGYVLRSMEVSYPTYRVELKPKADDRTLIVLRHPTVETIQTHILVDTERHVVLRIENLRDGKVTTTTRFGDFIQAAGAWWATRVESFNGSGERTSTTTLTFTELDPPKFAARMKRELAPRDQVQLLHEPLPAVDDAKQALADEKTDFEDRIVLAVHFARIQNWERVTEHLAAAAVLGEKKPGMRWVDYALWKQSRRREELRTAIMAETQEATSYYLATYLVGQASSVFSAGEMLELLDSLLPVYQRQPKHLLAMKSWKQQRLNYLYQTGQQDAALELRGELAESYPHDYGLQQQYANALAAVGDYKAAYAWYDATIVSERRWLPNETDSLRGTYTSLLEKEGRYDDLVEYLAAWVPNNPVSETPYRQYLSALVRADEEDQANERIAKWLAVEVRDDQTPLAPADAARLSAAVYQALGQGHGLHTNRLEDRWIEPLAGLVERFAMHKTHFPLADRVMSNSYFRQQDACRRVRKETVARLTNEIDTLPIRQIPMLVNWVWPNDPAVEEKQWRKIATGLERRWEREDDANVKNQFAAALIQILSGRLTAEEHLAFLRRQLKQGPEQYRVSYVNQLFNAVIAQPWTAELEEEAFTLLPRLSAEATQPSERLRVQVTTLYRFTDRMVQARNDALMLEVEHQEEMTKTEQREKKSENLRAAREGFAKRLHREMKTAADDMRPWLGVERLYLLVLLGDDLDRVADECWEVLGAKPPKAIDPTDKTVDVTAVVLDGILRERHLAIVVNLAVRRDAKPQHVNRLLAYFDAGIDTAGDDKVAASGWRMMKYRMLIALDRPKDLEAALDAWIKPADADNYWRRALGYLLAEQGRIKEAIPLLEQVERADELSPADYRALAGWYMVVDARDKHERALIQAFKASEEHQLSNWISQKLQPWRRSDSPMPDELDKDVLRVFAALFEKSGSPQNYLSYLGHFYGATRDFRLLASLPDAVIGHTAGRVYPFLQSMGNVLGEIRDEATADSLIERLEEVRTRAKTPIDHRALDLLELLVERRCSEVLNQPGPHIDRALSAMQRAFGREWSDGEPRLMADLLASLGRITQEPLTREQVRQLTVLHDREERGSIDRLHIAHALARTHWSYSRHDRAIDLLEAALAEHETAIDGPLPQYANAPLDTFIGYLESRVYHARGERYLFAQLEHPIHQQQRYWLVQRLYQLYDSAIASDGEVSLGRGAELYRAAQRILQDELKTDDQNHRHQLLNRLCTIYRTAHHKKIPGVVADLRKFAFERFPQVLGRQTNNYQSMVNSVAGTLHDLAGPRDGLELLIERIENEPRWFRLNNQDGWSQYGYHLAEWRREVGTKLGDLEPRLLAIVIAELKRDLRSRRKRNACMYHRHYSYFWSEKAEDFFLAAEEVYAKQKKSGAAVQYIADYLWHGLDRHDRAIEILMIAHRRKILDESGQSKLVHYLHERGRFQESIPILLPLVESRPDNIQYRVWLMHAFYQVGRKADLLALLEATDTYFHEGNRWQESIIAHLASSCLQNHLFEQSAAYYEEVIELHQRTQPNRGIGNGTLSSYYASLSQAYSGLKKTPEAVDAACGAIVSWGPRHDTQRANALRSLERVLRNAPDLEDYIAHLDNQAKETGMQNPIVRKALGKVYFDKHEYKLAIPQLEQAIESQPNDTETHQTLIACYDKLGEKESAIRQLLESVRLSRRNIGLFKDLAARYDALEKTTQAERARTSIVEALPNESEGHTMLAEIRQRQDRWGAAIAHWQQVAEIRSLEPTGLLKLAAAQIHEKQWDAADATCRKLRARSWPSRFGHIEQQIRNFERQIDTGRKTTHQPDK